MTDVSEPSEAEVIAAAKAMAERAGDNCFTSTATGTGSLHDVCIYYQDQARAALTAAAQVRERAQNITIEEPTNLRATLATMKGAKKNGVNMNIWDRDIEAVEQAIAVIDAIRQRPPLMPIYGATEPDSGESVLGLRKGEG